MKVDIKTKEQLARMREACRMSAEIRDICAQSVMPGMRTEVRFDQGVRIALDYIMKHPEECQQADPDFDAWCDRVIEALENAKKGI